MLKTDSSYICSMNTIETIYKHFLQSTGISTDTRQLKPGSIFFALKGPNHNANLWVEKALEGGAAFAVADDPLLAKDQRVFIVEDTLKTLQQLAILHRSKMSAKIIGITGSNGKTTTKELVFNVLSSVFNTIATEGNLNNHIGVPLTILRIKPETEMAVIEMGANHMGEIMQLCKIAQPDYGLITNIGKAHIEGFGSLTGVINAKSELYSWIDDHGKLLFVNADNELLNRLSVNISRFTYGEALHNNLYGELVADQPYLHIAYEYQDQQAVIATRIIGAYNTENILAAISIGCYFGIKADKIVSAISSYIPSNSRSQLIETKTNKVIMDAYNANPVSMAAAITNFDRMRGAKAVVIIGDMLELGDSSDMEHAEILKLLTDLDFNQVFLVGPLFERVYAGDDWLHFNDVDGLFNYLKKKPIRNSDVLVKASRGIKLEKVLPLL